jgi:flavin-dependent thymidylate synthase
VSGTVEKWADDFMFRSESHNAAAGPRVHLLAMSADPLGQIAACAKMYKGEVVRDLSEVTHAERVEYMEEMQKTKLKMPLEAVQFHFMIENVTRAFTHQLVRQRTAAYAQESMRFAVVEDMTEAVALPPSLAGTVSLEEWWAKEEARGIISVPRMLKVERDLYIERSASEQQKQRFKWDKTVSTIGSNYMDLVNGGMPAEDARGLMPTNIVTRINYITNLRGLLDHAGNRLCTQAQFEWRLVFAQIANAIRNYNPMGAQAKSIEAANGQGDEIANTISWVGAGNSWQYEAIANILRPVCYQTGSCAFKANFDRKCSIRERVDANADIGRSSGEWGEEYDAHDPVLNVDAYGQRGGTGVGRRKDDDRPIFIGAIHPAEWLADPAAAR